jgi:DUF1365 family protein
VLFYLDLEEIGRLFRVPALFSEKPSLLRFRRADYLGDPATPLDQSVRDLVEQETGTRPDGPIRMLTQLRYLFFCFNPVTFYYCFDADGETLRFIVAEITNTPWNERHSYVLPCLESERVKAFSFPKRFHVSPFMPMEMDYAWRFTTPGKAIDVLMENFSKEDALVFDASLTLRRKDLSASNVILSMLSFPLLTLKTFVAIYFQALLLKLKSVPFHPHPLSGE